MGLHCIILSTFLYIWHFFVIKSWNEGVEIGEVTNINFLKRQGIVGPKTVSLKDHRVRKKSREPWSYSEVTGPVKNMGNG